jgi:hypothetical protein
MLDKPYTTSGQKQTLLPTHILQHNLASIVHSTTTTNPAHAFHHHLHYFEPNLQKKDPNYYRYKDGYAPDPFSFKVK